LKILFAGTPDFAAVVLRALLGATTEVCAVYTQPDRPAGRGRRLQPGAVKVLAEEHGIVVEQPDRLKDAEAIARLRSYHPDLMIVVAYGLILPAEVLAIPRLGCINLHASLLPRWRGAAPVQRAILAGDSETGISLMQMEAGLDTGPVLATRSTAITPDDTSVTLHERLAEISGALLVEQLEALSAQALPLLPQSVEGVTYAHKISKAEAVIQWDRPAEEIGRTIRAFNPWPVAETRLNGLRLRLWRGQPLPASEPLSDLPGRVVAVDRDGIRVACGEGFLLIQELQTDGGRRLPVSAFLNASPVVVGDRLGSFESARVAGG